MDELEKEIQHLGCSKCTGLQIFSKDFMLYGRMNNEGQRMNWINGTNEGQWVSRKNLKLLNTLRPRLKIAFSLRKKWSNNFLRRQIIVDMICVAIISYRGQFAACLVELQTKVPEDYVKISQSWRRPLLLVESTY